MLLTSRSGPGWPRRVLETGRGRADDPPQRVRGGAPAGAGRDRPHHRGPRAHTEKGLSPGMGPRPLRRTGLISGLTAVLTVATAAPVLTLPPRPGGADAPTPPLPAESNTATPPANTPPGHAAGNPPRKAMGSPGNALGDVAKDAAGPVGEAVGSALEDAARDTEQTLQGALGETADEAPPTDDLDDAPTPQERPADGDTATPSDAGSDTEESQPATTSEAEQGDEGGLVDSVGETLSGTVEDTTDAAGATLDDTLGDTTDTTEQAANTVITEATATVDGLLAGVLDGGGSPPQSDVPPLAGDDGPGSGADDGNSTPPPGDGGDAGPDPVAPTEADADADSGTRVGLSGGAEPGTDPPPSLASPSPWEGVINGLTPAAIPGWLVATAVVLAMAVGGGHVLHAVGQLRQARRGGPSPHPAR